MYGMHGRWVRLARAIDKLGEAAGQGVAVAIARGDWDIAEAFAAEALERNDHDETEDEP